MKKLFTLASAVVLFSIFAFPALAQYDSDVVEPRYEEGIEIFGINTDGDQTLTLYPEGCKSIDRVLIKIKGSVDGELKFTSLNEESPFNDKKIDKVYEYCHLEFDDIDEGDVESINIDAKVRKTWFSKEDVSEDNLGVYAFENDKWEYKDTKKDKENTLNFFYTSEVPYTEYLAVGEHKGSSLPFGLNPWILLICCVGGLFLLLLLSIIFSANSRKARRGGSN